MVALRVPDALADDTPVDLTQLRWVGAAMLGVAAVRPLVPFEFVPPCPLCGMTRGVTAAVHLELGKAVLLNPGSIVAVVLTILILVAWRTKRVTIPVWVFFVLLGLMWSWELFKYATGRAL